MRSFVIMSVIALAGLVQQAAADPGCARCNQQGGCSQCGCGQCGKKVCRLKCEMKSVTTFCYECKCEDICVPGPSKCCGTRKVADCNARCGYRTETIWQPTCGCVRTRKVLVKVPVTKQVPVYTCEVVRICGGCGHAALDEDATAEARAKEIIPASAEEPLALEADTAPSQSAVLSDKTVDVSVAKGSFLSRIFSR